MTAIPKDPARSARWAARLPLFVAVGGAALVYHGILRNFFYGDDFLHLYELRTQPLSTYLLQPHGFHLLVSWKAWLAALHAVFGLAPRGYFCVILLMHLACAGLLFHVIRGCTGSTRLACAGAVVWATAPVQQGTLGWISVAGHILAALVLLAFLHQLDRAAAGRVRVSPALVAWWWVLLLLGAASFGVGIGIALASPLIALLWLPPGGTRTRVCLALAALWIVVPALYTLDVHAHRSPVRLIPYPYLQAWWQNISMLGALIQAGLAGLIVHLPSGVVKAEGLETLLGSLYGLGLLAALTIAPPRARRLLLAVVLLSLASYGMIAVGRAVFLGGRVGVVRAATEQRYHYAGTLTLVLGTCVAISVIAGRCRVPARGRDLLLGLVVAGAVGRWWLGGWRIDHHDGARRATEQSLAYLRRAIAAVPPGQAVRFWNAPFGGRGYVPRTEFPDLAGLFVVAFPTNTVEGRPVLFLESDAAVVAAARQSGRTATLFLHSPRGPHPLGAPERSATTPGMPPR